jgi:hypothetical protein
MAQLFDSIKHLALFENPKRYLIFFSKPQFGNEEFFRSLRSVDFAKTYYKFIVVRCIFDTEM